MGYMAVIGSAAQRRKNPQKLSVGGPESGPLLFHSNNVSGTNTTAPSSKPSRQTFKPVIGRHKEAETARAGRGISSCRRRRHSSGPTGSGTTAPAGPLGRNLATPRSKLAAPTKVLESDLSN